MAQKTYYPETDIMYPHMRVGTPGKSGFWIVYRNGTFGLLSTESQCAKDHINYFMLPDECYVDTDALGILKKSLDHLAKVWRRKYIGTPYVYYPETELTYAHLHVYWPNTAGYYVVLRERALSKTTRYEVTHKDDLSYFHLPVHLWIGDEPEALLTMAASYATRRR